MVLVHDQQAGDLQSQVPLRRDHTTYTALSIPIPMQHREDVVLACRVCIGMISRSPFCSPCRPHAPTTHLTGCPTALAPAPHVRSARVGRPTASPSNHRDLAFVDFKKPGTPGSCISSCIALNAAALECCAAGPQLLQAALTCAVHRMQHQALLQLVRHLMTAMIMFLANCIGASLQLG